MPCVQKTCPSCSAECAIAKQICPCGKAFPVKERAATVTTATVTVRSPGAARTGAGTIDHYVPANFTEAPTSNKRLNNSGSCPRGRAPLGKTWDTEAEQWVDENDDSNADYEPKKKAKTATKAAGYLHTARFGDSGEQLLGFRLRKVFPATTDSDEHVVCKGWIRSFRMVQDGADLYSIEYDDGTEEEVTLGEMITEHNKAAPGTGTLGERVVKPKKTAKAVKPKKTAKVTSSTCSNRPRGRPPLGKTWDEDSNGWV